MKTIIHLNLTDDQRELFAHALCKKGMVSRKEVTAWVEEAIEQLLTTQENNDDQGSDTQLIPTEAIEAITEPLPPQTVGDRSLREFVPSRGDEPYLYKPENPELAAACSAILDGLQYIETRVWDELERNRR